MGKELVMLMLSYCEIRSEMDRPSGAPTKINAAQFNAAQRRKP